MSIENIKVNTKGYDFEPDLDDDKILPITSDFKINKNNKKSSVDNTSLYLFLSGIIGEDKVQRIVCLYNIIRNLTFTKIKSNLKKYIQQKYLNFKITYKEIKFAIIKFILLIYLSIINFPGLIYSLILNKLKTTKQKIKLTNENLKSKSIENGKGRTRRCDLFLTYGPKITKMIICIIFIIIFIYFAILRYLSYEFYYQNVININNENNNNLILNVFKPDNNSIRLHNWEDKGFIEWIDSNKFEFILEKEFINGYFESNTFDFGKLNVSLFHLDDIFNSYINDSDCLNGIDIGIDRNIIFIKSINETIYNPYISVTSKSQNEMEFASLRGNITRKIKVPTNMLVIYKSKNGKKNEYSFEDVDSACIFMYLNNYTSF